MEESIHVHPNTEKITSGSHSSYWVDSVRPLAFQKLQLNTETDVVIVGGGIAGVSIAYCLIKSGKRVVIVEDGFIGSGETGRTTAHLVTALDDRYYELERRFGKEKTKLIAQSHKSAINFIEHTIKNEHIDCDFERVDGYLFLHPSDKPDSLDKEIDAIKNAGLEALLIHHIPDIRYTGPCIKFPDQAQFNPLKYIEGLCDVIEKSGGIIYTNTHAKIIDSDGITTDDGFRVKAKHIVVATNTPVNNRIVMHLKQYPYRTYVIGAKIKKDSLTKALWWDTGNFDVNKDVPPYHYVRTQSYNDTHDLLIIGGEDHPTGLADIENIPEEERYDLLQSWARQYFDIEEVIYKWSGQVMEPMDGLAYIGRNPFDSDNVYIVTGDSGNGMTHSTIAATLIDDLINGRENKYVDIYDPSRFKLFTAGNVFIKNFIGGFTNYYKNKRNNASDTHLDTIQKNEGKIIEVEGKKYGVFCDEHDHLHYVSAKCTHLGCSISWNNDEKSWDCPCHGSRFSHEGKVLNGPANKDLSYHQELKPKS